MSEAASYTVRDGVAIVTMNNPPVNGLGSVLRPGIMDAIKKADADPAVGALVIIGSAKAFSGGADIREFNTPKMSVPPSLPEINESQDACCKPMIAAIGGFALGGGLELALGCHYRVALPKSQLGLPEVKLGLLPGSGGTQRLPRIVGAAQAVQMMTTGNSIAAEKALALGLVDEVVQGDLLEGAISFAKKLLEQKKGPRRIRDMTVKIDGDPKAFFEKARASGRITFSLATFTSRRFSFTVRPDTVSAAVSSIDSSCLMMAPAPRKRTRPTPSLSASQACEYVYF